MTFFSRFAFEKETYESVCLEGKRIMDEIEALKEFNYKPDKWTNVEIRFCCHMTKLDQKIVCYLKGKKGMMQCPYCDATPTNRMLNETQFFSPTTLIDLGLSSLHFGINSLKLIINVGSNQVWKA